jgi:hypothetical protein
MTFQTLARIALGIVLGVSTLIAIWAIVAYTVTWVYGDDLNPIDSLLPVLVMRGNDRSEERCFAA